MKKFKPNYSFADLWKQFVMFTKNWRRKSTGELVSKDKLELTGDVKCFENIVDKDGHKRFIEGEGTTPTITLTGEGNTYDILYSKWSLSGTHLMIVLSFIVNPTSDTKITDIQWALSDIPEWVADKIVATSSNIVDRKQSYLFDESGNTLQEMTMSIMKDNDDTIRLTNLSQSAEYDEPFMMRVQLDLLIDNAESE